MGIDFRYDSQKKKHNLSVFIDRLLRCEGFIQTSNFLVLLFTVINLVLKLVLYSFNLSSKTKSDETSHAAMKKGSDCAASKHQVRRG